MTEKPEQNEHKPKTEHKAKTGSAMSGKMVGGLAVVAIVFFALGYIVTGLSATGMVAGVPATTAAGEAIDFINSNMLPDGMAASLVNVTEESGIYKIAIEISGEDGSMLYDSFVTKDGKMLFTSGVDLTMEIPEQPETTETQTPTVTKSDSPAVDVFIMSYCPYGLQMTKALLPAWELLEDSADINLRFVYYAMHGEEEIDENTRMYCIQKDQRDKLLDYLTCFTATGEVDSCLTSAGVDTAALDTCMADADTEFSITANFEDQDSWLSGRFPLYDVNKDLNELYGVGGSPTVVINGQTASVSRSPEAVKQAICNAFNTPPEACSQTLSTETVSAGFGASAGTTATGGCGA